MWAEVRFVKSSSLSSSVCLLDSENLTEVTGENRPTREKELEFLTQLLSKLIFMWVRNKIIELRHWDVQVYLLWQVVVLINIVPTQIFPPALSMMWALQARRCRQCYPFSNNNMEALLALYLLTSKDHSEFSQEKKVQQDVSKTTKLLEMITWNFLKSLIKLEPHCKWTNVQTFSDVSMWDGANRYDIVESRFWTKRETTWFQPSWFCPPSCEKLQSLSWPL